MAFHNSSNTKHESRHIPDKEIMNNFTKQRRLLLGFPQSWGNPGEGFNMGIRMDILHTSTNIT